MPRTSGASRWHRALLACAAAAIACVQDFPSQPDLTVTLGPASPWPQLLSVTDVDTLEVAITGGAGALVTGLVVEWQSSKPAVLEVAVLPPPPGATRSDSLAARLRAVVTARASDTVTIMVRVVHAGFAPAELRLPLLVEPLRLALSGDSLSAGLAVTDTAITGVTIANARDDTLSGMVVAWSSSNPAVLQVSTITRAGPDSGKAQTIALRSGAAEVIATVAPPGFAPAELRSPVTIEPLLVQPVGPPIPPLLRVTDERIIAVAVRTTSGQPRAGRPVSWSSSDPAVVQVTGVQVAHDTAFARLTAFRQGSARIVAAVAPPAFETSELQDTVAVDSIDVQPVATWPDSLTVTRDDTVGVQTSNAPGAIITWRSSDLSVLGVVGNINGRPDSAVLTGRGRGAADVLVTVERTGYQPSVLRQRIGVDTIRLVRLDVALGATLTVLDTVRTRVALRGVHDSPIGATWSTSDPAVLRVAVVTQAGDPDSGKVQVVALQRGPAAVTASVVGPSSFTPVVLQVPILVAGLVLQPAAPFPTSLTVTDSQIVSILPRTSLGQTRSGVVTAWSSSDPSILQVRALGTTADTTRAMLTALQLGSAQVVAAIAPTGFEPSEFRSSVTMDSIRVTLDTGIVWPDNLTVTEDSTVKLRLNDGTVSTAAVSVTWRSSDPNVLGVVGDAALPLRALLTANRHGSADVIAAVSRGGFLISTFSRRVTVDSLVVDQVPGAALPSGLTVTDDALARVRVRRNATGGSLITGLPVAWSSSNPAVLQVVNSGIDTARVTALRAGTADVIATVNPTGTEPVQFRSTISITGLTVTQDSTRLWPDTMAATDDSVLNIWVTGGGGRLTRALPVRWQVGNGTSQTLTGRSALLHAASPGWAFVTVVVGQAPYDTTFYRDSVRVMQRWISVSTGGGQTCGVTVDSTAYCWGLFRSAGDGRSGGSVTPTRVVSPYGDQKFYRVSVSAGFDEGSACGIVRGGILYCWGSNSRYQLGNGTSVDQLLATPALSVGGVLDVAAGFEATCGVTVDSTAMCWGLKDYNQTGDFFRGGAVSCTAFGMTGTSCLPPGNIGFLGGSFYDHVPKGGFVSVSVGAHHACGVTSARVGWCWGLDDFGQSGTDTSAFSPLGPITCTLVSSSGSLDHQCRLPSPAGRAGGSLQFRFISAGGDANSMTLVPNNDHLGGRGFSCGVTTSDELYCWGLNDQGALGTTSSGTCPFYPYGSVATTVLNLPCSRTPVLVGSGYVAVATGARHACALTTSGVARCWGGNNTSQLGATTAQQCSTYQWQIDTAIVLVPCSTQPVVVEGGHRLTTLSAGADNTCGIATSGAIYCWGNNQSGQLGDLTQLARPTPVRVAEPQ